MITAAKHLHKLWNKLLHEQTTQWVSYEKEMIQNGKEGKMKDSLGVLLEKEW